MPRKKAQNKPVQTAADMAVATLVAVCADESAKDTDRVAAAKLLLEYGEKNRAQSDSMLTVAFENIPEEYLK